MRRLTPALLALALVSVTAASRIDQSGSSLQGSYRRAPRDGWTYVHLQGTPAAIGYQHGWLLYREIKDGFDAQKLELRHDAQKDWEFFRSAARTVLWPHVPDEYREELTGITAGLNARGVRLDIWDVVALNAAMEWSYYVQKYDRDHGIRPPSTVKAPDHCSAFVATGSWTRDGKVVVAHNNWSSYMDGERWTIIFDVTPARGRHFVMDGYPGFIHSGDDFAISDAGLVITETTISGFEGWDSNGIPEFVRARKALQYAESIDDFSRIMREGNNGGYANGWLVADIRTNEIASLELGLKNVELRRTRDGWFAGANFPVNRKLLREETTFNPDDPSLSANARRVRWDQLIGRSKGKIDVTLAKKFLADHYDPVARRAYALRPRRSVAARHGRLEGAVSARGLRPEHRDGCGDGRADVVPRRRRACLRNQL